MSAPIGQPATSAIIAAMSEETQSRGRAAAAACRSSPTSRRGSWSASRASPCPRSFPAGTRVFHEGDRSDACYIVTRGQLPGHPRALRRARDHPRHPRPRRDLRRAGDARRRQRSASAEALSDGELLALPAGDVRALLARHPEISVKLVAGLVRRLRAANERISRQSFQTVPSRVAGVLSQLSREAQDGGEAAER